MAQTVSVQANKFWFETGIQLVAGTKYTFTATGEWIDQTIHCGPDGYTLQEEISDWQIPMFRMVEPFRPINTGDTWFQLVGKVGNSLFVIGSGITYIPHENGELVCCANDCPFMYWNNTGALSLNRHVRWHDKVGAAKIETPGRA